MSYISCTIPCILNAIILARTHNINGFESMQNDCRTASMFNTRYYLPTAVCHSIGSQIELCRYPPAVPRLPDDTNGIAAQSTTTLGTISVLSCYIRSYILGLFHEFEAPKSTQLDHKICVIHALLCLFSPLVSSSLRLASLAFSLHITLSCVELDSTLYAARAFGVLWRAGEGDVVYLAHLAR